MPTSFAEGVETEAEAETLVELGYTAAQGFLFARPMRIEDRHKRLLSQRAADSDRRRRAPRRKDHPDRRGGSTYSR